ncbi:MAG TPA: efflux RND transporter periplasmic adaptor subunit [Acidobacteriaceae bacterium]|nr:efflux RND transporter periplasmic adaptor subunit [Acidobacteriaceae bacterium]
MKTFLLGAPMLLAALAGCATNPHLQPDQSSPMQAKVIEVSRTSAAGSRPLTGVIAARMVAEISSQVSAPVAAVHVREGDSVRKGQILVQLTSVPLQAAVEQAQSQVLAAKKQEAAAQAQKTLAGETYARYSTLNDRHSVTPHEFDQVKAQLAAANAQFEAASAQTAAAEAATRQSQAMSSYTVIRAPFNGIVSKKYADPGTLASPGTPLLRIEDARDHEVDLAVNESSLRTLHAGEKVEVLVNGGTKTIEGVIREIVPSGDPAAHTFTVKIGLPPSPALYSGMTASVLLPVGEQQTITVAKTAVEHRGQLDSVLALDSSSVAQIRYVTLGTEQGDKVEVISGLAPGDRILAQPSDSYIGRRIEAQP